MFGEMLPIRTMTSAETARAFNNAGVSFLEAGHGAVAWDLFKGALEVNLASERSRGQQASHFGESDTYIRKAESHMQNLENYSFINATNTATDSLLFEYPSMRGEGILVPLDSSTGCFFKPYISCRPFRIADEPSNAGPSRALASEEDRTMSATEITTIIFNLALFDHLHRRTSNQAISLYELATTLMVGEDLCSLAVALINNIGVWCYDSGDIFGALRCMDHLSQILDGCDSLDERERGRLVSNIQRMLIPPSSASPAA
jgi:hypothetical protein